MIRSEDGPDYRSPDTKQSPPYRQGPLAWVSSAELRAELTRRLPVEHKQLLQTPLAATAYLRDYLQATQSGLEREVFGVLWLNASHGVIAVEELAHGTIDQAAVYPREVVKSALSRGAAACIFYHNHPSGAPEPSTADRVLTTRLVDALKLFGIRVVDHLVIGSHSSVSLSERGQM